MAVLSILRRSAGCVGATVFCDFIHRHRSSHSLPRPVICQGIADKLDTDSTSIPRASRKIRLRRDDLIFENKSGLQEEYAVEGNIGAGRGGKVFEAMHRRMGVKRAVKEIFMADMLVHDIGEEVRALIGLDHPHVVKAIEYFVDDTHFYLVQELCTGPDLFDYALQQEKKHGMVSEKAASIILRQCIKAVICCHAHGYIHRDIKPENFMVTGADNTVKMIDFGVATRFLSTEQLTRFAGTLDYMSPEMLQNHKYSFEVDLWSLGVLFFVLLSIEHLLPEEKTQKRKMLRDPGYVARRLNACAVLRKRNLSKEARDLLERLLEFDPSKRITAREALAHPFIRKHWGVSLDHDRPVWHGDLYKDVIEKFRDFAASPRLRKTALLAVAHLATAQEHPQDLKEVSHAFRFIDASGDGHITCNQLVHKLREEGIDVPVDLADTFSLCDSNSSGALSYVEFVACCFPASCLDEKLCAEAFHLLDRESDGKISHRDLQQLCQSYRYLSMEYKEMIREVDPSGKGYLDIDDFHRLLHGELPRRPQRLKKSLVASSVVDWNPVLDG